MKLTEPSFFQYLGDEAALQAKAQADPGLRRAYADLAYNARCLFALLSQQGTPHQKRAARFAPPTPEEVKLQCQKIALPESEGEAFANFYASKGWKVGKVQMVSWVSALSNWKKSWEERRYMVGNGHGPSSTLTNDTVLKKLKALT
jgi:hypothetical protein